MVEVDDDGVVVLERVLLRRVTTTLAYASVRLPYVHLSGLKVEATPGGHLTITPPGRLDSVGRFWPNYSIQPECKVAVEAEIARMWARS